MGPEREPAVSASARLSMSLERRGKPRVTCSYPATLRGSGDDGSRYDARAVLSNMSASGMYIFTKRPLRLGARIFIVVRMSTRPLGMANLPQLAARGNVVRVEPRVDGAYGVALKLNRYRFL